MMKKAFIDKAIEKGLFHGFKFIRDSMYKPETPLKIKYGGTGLEIFSTKFKNLRYATHTDGWTEVANKKLELLGIIYYYKKWKKYVWEQCPEIIMTDDCLEKVKGIIEIIKKK
jgi:hypothetical protein